MLRRSFRFGLWVGLLVGIAYALSKLLRPRESPATLDLGSRGGSLGRTPDAWPPLEAPEATMTPIQIPEPDVAPVAKTQEPGLITVGDEPFHTPPEDVRTSLSAPPPAKAAPKKAPPKKAGPKKAAAKKAAAPKKAPAKKAPAKKQAPPPDA